MISLPWSCWCRAGPAGSAGYPSHNGNPSNGYVNPCEWIDDHPLICISIYIYTYIYIYVYMYIYIYNKYNIIRIYIYNPACDYGTDDHCGTEVVRHYCDALH